MILLWICSQILELKAADINISTIPSTVSVGDNFTITSTISNTSTWQYHRFSINDANFCFTTVPTSSQCISVFECDIHEYTFDCDFINFNLHIKNVSTNLNGYIFRSELKMSSGVTISSNVTIVVNIPLQSVYLSPAGIVSIADTKQQILICSATSKPHADLIWKIENLPLRNPPITSTNGDTVTSSLNYTAKKSDKGKNLTCTAKSGNSMFTDVVLLDVQYLPTVTVIPSFNPYNIIENATSAQLICNVTDSNPLPSSFRWYKDETILSFNSTYYMTNVNRSNAGTYRCHANNSVGGSNVALVNVNILYGVSLNGLVRQNLVEGTKLNVTCSGQSNPVITDKDVIWKKANNDTFKMNGTRLVINNVQRQDKGTYMCTVVLVLLSSFGENVSVEGTTTVEVDVFYAPRVAIVPSESPYYVVENSTNVALACNVTEANPTVTTFKWYKNGIVIADTPSYIIAFVQKSSDGIYTCSAENSVGSSANSSGKELNVRYGVQLNNLSTQQPVEGTNLIITCSGQSNPVITDKDVIWKKANNNTFKMNGTRLVINNIKRQDKGTYVCTVVLLLISSYGETVSVEGTTTVEVDVFYVPQVAIIPSYSPYNVEENNTNVVLTCDAVQSNPNVSSYKWFKNGLAISENSTYKMSFVQKSDAGIYTCSAANTAGSSKHSSGLELNVLYGVVLTVAETEISVNETNTFNLTCNANGNPTPELQWKHYYNNSIFNHPVTANKSTVEVKNANCKDTGTYLCSGHNTIRNDSATVHVKVACSPRNSKETASEYVYVKGRNESFLLTATIISYPVSVMTWFRRHPDGNITMIGDEFNISYISKFTPVYPYESVSELQKDVLYDEDLGDYILNASNKYGLFTLTFHVRARRIPDKPAIISRECYTPGETTITWKAGFNGGQSQHFKLWYSVNKPDNPKLHDVVNDTNLPQYSSTVSGLQEGSLYYFYVESVNNEGSNKTSSWNCTVKKSATISEIVIDGIAGSITGVVFLLVLGTFVAVRTQRRNSTGLHNNILYVSADDMPLTNASDTSDANKETHSNEFSNVYTAVIKPKRRNRHLNGQEVYENVEMPLFVPFNKLKEIVESDKTATDENPEGQYVKKTNKDGLVYADLQLNNDVSGRKFVIRGLENRTHHADIDLSRTAEPLPSDDSESEESHKTLKEELHEDE